MDPAAARRARRRKIKVDLLDAFDDEEACPPEWVDLLAEVRAETEDLRDLVRRETDRFAREPDIRRALDRRGHVASAVRERASEINARIRRLNLLAPLARFQRATLDLEALLRPLYRTRRRAG